MDEALLSFALLRRWFGFGACALLVALGLESVAPNSNFAQGRRSRDASIKGTIRILGEQGKEVSPPPDTVVVVQLLKKGQTTKIKTGLKSPKGDYEILGIDPGRYNLVAHNGGSYQRDEVRNRKINEGPNYVDFVLKHVSTAALGKLNGVATTPEGKILPGTKVGIYLPDCDDCPIEQTTTNAIGAFAFQAAPDSYRLGVISRKDDGTEVVAFVSDPIRIGPTESTALSLALDWRDGELRVFRYLRDQPAPLTPKSENVMATTVGNSISGRLTFNRGAVPGVTVSVTGANGRTQVTTTNEDGDFRLLNLEPGSYTVVGESSSTLSGFTQLAVQVSVSTPAVLNVQLPPLGSTEIAQVTVSDVSTSMTLIANTPVLGRKFEDLLTLTPGVSIVQGPDGDEINFSGQRGIFNNISLDGVTTSDSAFGGSGANLPFEFVREVEIKTGAYGAEYGHSTGAIFNVVTKSGGNTVTGDAFAYFTTKGLVRSTENFPFSGLAPDGFSEIDAGFDIGGPIIKDKLWFFGALNPQQRKNHFLTQTLRQEVENKITTPFYAGKLTWAVNQANVFTFSTFGDYTKQEGHLFPLNGFGTNLASFRGVIETGGTNYAFRLNSNLSQTWIGEFSVGLHFQRANTLPELAGETLVTDRFAVLRNGVVLPVTETTVGSTNGVNDGLRLAFVEGTGGTVHRNFVRSGFGLQSQQDRDRWDLAARLQNIYGRHTIKYGFEYAVNMYGINTRSTGPNLNFNAAGVPAGAYRIENRFAICSRTSTTTITCPSDSRTANVQGLINAGQAPVGVTTAVTGAVSINPTNPFLLLDVVRARDVSLNTRREKIKTNVESFYIQDDFKISKDVQFNFGLRWDFQQAYSAGDVSDIKLNNFMDNLQPRVGLVWDFTGRGRGKVFINYARFLEAPLPTGVNVQASGGAIHNDFNLNVSRLNGAAGAVAISNFGNLGGRPAPVDLSLKPQTVNEVTGGMEFEAFRDFALGFRGIYRAQGSVIEDGSFDEGVSYFIFNPGESATERLACNDPLIGCFGRARRYYRALEFSVNKRFSNNYQIVASYTFSSLIGNYEGLFRNDNEQSDPSITSLFDLVSLRNGRYGRLPNDRPHQFKFDGSYRTPFKLMVSGSFRAQSGIPFNALVPHPVYGDNEGFCIPGLSCVPRGTAVVPDNTSLPLGNAGKESAVNSTRMPFTWNGDFGAYYPFQIGENHVLRLHLDWFNVFNNQRAVRLDETFMINSGAPDIAPVPNPFWGTGTIFHFPSNLRLGVKFTF